MLTLEDYRGDSPTWCPGCGHFGVLSGLQQACLHLGIEPHRIAVVAAPGCGGDLAAFFRAHAVAGLTGPLATATGLKLADGEMTVVVAGGDAHAYGDGLTQLGHTARRNPDVTYIVLDSQGRAPGDEWPAPAAPHAFPPGPRPLGHLAGSVSRSLLLALRMGCTFVAQGFAGDVDRVAQLIERGMRHRGFSLINVLSPCVLGDRPDAYDFYRRHLVDIERIGPRPADRGEAVRACLDHPDGLCGVLWEERQPSLEEVLQVDAGSLARVDIAADRRWEDVLDEFR